jgi:HlyD family secretion protein
MTTTVEFLTASAGDVLTVPNAALRVRPTDAMLAEAGAGRGAASDSARRGVRSDSTRGGATPDMTGRRATSDSARHRSSAFLWYLDAKGRVARMRVRTGLTDGQRTQVQAPELKAGVQVIVGTTGAEQGSAPPGQSTNPFQPARGMGRGTR